MKMDLVAGSKNDEFYTPEYAIYPKLYGGGQLGATHYYLR